MVDRRGEQVVREGPLRVLAPAGPGERAVARQVPDQDRQPAGREPFAVPVEEVDAVVPQQVGFQRLGVLVDEYAEAQSSPTPSPVSLP